MDLVFTRQQASAKHFRPVPALCRPGLGFQLICLFCRPPLPSHTPLSFVVLPDYSSHFCPLRISPIWEWIQRFHLRRISVWKRAGPVSWASSESWSKTSDCEDEPTLRCNSRLSLWKPFHSFMSKEKLWFRNKSEERNIKNCSPKKTYSTQESYRMKVFLIKKKSQKPQTFAQ